MASIICEDCGHHRYRTPRNTRYCKKCRLLRDVEYWQKNTRVCRSEGCEREFAPISRGDYHCGACQMGQTANRGHCAICDRDDRYLLYKDLAACEQCARHPGLRKRFISALRAGQEKRIANPPTEPLRQPKPRSPWPPVDEPTVRVDDTPEI